MSVIIGAGPNLGAAVARRFGREGMPVGLIARNRDKLDALAGDLRGEGITADVETADIRDAPRSHRPSPISQNASAPSRSSSTPRCPPESS